jgi:hypothetical protein
LDVGTTVHDSLEKGNAMLIRRLAGCAFLAVAVAALLLLPGSFADGDDLTTDDYLQF